MMVDFNLANNWSDYPEFQVTVNWRKLNSNDKFYIYEADKEGDVWNIRLNDFPDEPLYSLIRNNEVIMHFDDWPEFWEKPI